MITIQLNDQRIRQEMAWLRQMLSDMTPVMQSVGELLVERTKRRFATSTDPEGHPWAPNAPATIRSYLRRFGGTFRRDGSLSRRGQLMAARKKPLIGETRQLMQTLYYRATRDRVEIGSPMQYAAIHQFGGRAGRGHRVQIPARPYFPIDASGQPYGRADWQAVIEIITESLQP